MAKKNNYSGHQISINEWLETLISEKPKTKKYRLIEFFAGYGSQHLALDYLGADFESWKISEWAVKSIQAYKDLHFKNDNTDYSKSLNKEQLVDLLYSKCISNDYNKPMTYEQIKRLSEDKLRTIYNNMIATHNLGSITTIKGSDLQIVDTDNYNYILTYSFPCQDLSLAGLGAGLSENSNTRSSLLWEVKRVLSELAERERERERERESCLKSYYLKMLHNYTQQKICPISKNGVSF